MSKMKAENLEESGLLPIGRDLLAKRNRDKSKRKRGRPKGKVTTKGWKWNQRVEMYHETLALVENRLNRDREYHTEMCKTANENMGGRVFDNPADLHQEFGFQLGLAVAGEAFLLFLSCDPGETSARTWIKLNKSLAKGIEPRKDGKIAELPEDLRDEIMKEANAFLESVPRDNVRQFNEPKFTKKEIAGFLRRVDNTPGRFPYVDTVMKRQKISEADVRERCKEAARMGFKVSIKSDNGRDFVDRE